MASSRAFTFVELLVSVSLMGAGVIALYGCFTMSASASRYITDRIQADFIMAKTAWDMKNYINENEIETEHIAQKSHGDNPVFVTVVRLKKMQSLKGLYLLATTVSWREGAKNVMITGSKYIKKAI